MKTTLGVIAIAAAFVAGGTIDKHVIEQEAAQVVTTIDWTIASSADDLPHLESYESIRWANADVCR